MTRQYLLVGANFFAAIGGGILIAAELGISKHSCPKGSILAFFIGIVIGLLFSEIVSQRLTRSIARWFSLTVAFTSIVLFVIVRTWNLGDTLHGAPELFFFVLLSLRFGLWFFARALRAEIVGSEKQGVALIELGYYSGAALGLVLGWELLSASLSTALLVDALLQTAAGIVDLVVIRNNPSSAHGPGTLKEKTDLLTAVGNDNALSFDYLRYRKLTLAVVCLTIGFQAVWFGLAEWVPPGGYILPCFYFGVGLSALVCKGFKIKFDWDSIQDRSGQAILTSEFKGIKFKPPFGLLTCVAALTMTIALLGLSQWQWSTAVLILTIVSAFTYQILVLSLLDRIGREEKSANLSEKIKQTYLIAAVATIFTIGLLCQTKSYSGYWLLTMACCLISFLAVRRHSEAQA